MSLLGAISFDILAVAKTRAGADAAMRDAERVEKSWTGGMGRIGSAARSMEGIIGAAFTGAAAKMSIDAIKAVEEGTDALIIKYQLTDAEVKTLQSSINNLTSTTTASFKEASDALGFIYHKYGLTGKAAEDAAFQMLQLGKFSGNTSQSIRDQTVILDAWNMPASEASLFLDKITMAAGKTGVPINTLTSELAESSSMLQQWGYTADEGLAIAANLGKAHVGVSSVLNGLKASLGDVIDKEKELKTVQEDMSALAKDRRGLERDLVEAQLRLRNASGSEEYLSAVHRLEEIKEALADNTAETDKAVKKQGELNKITDKTGKELFDDYVAQMKAAPDEMAAVKIASPVFGDKNASAMARLARSGAFDTGSLDLAGAEGLLGKTTERTQGAADEFGIFWNNVLKGLSPIGSVLGGAAGIFNDLPPEVRSALVLGGAGGSILGGAKLAGALFGGGLLGGGVAAGGAGTAGAAGGMSALSAMGMFAGGFTAAALIGLGMAHGAQAGNEWLNNKFGQSQQEQSPEDFIKSLGAPTVDMYGDISYGAYAEGGLITKPTLAMMGESGPEYVVPADKMPGDTYTFTIGTVNVSTGYDVDQMFRRFEENIARQRKQRGWRTTT